MQKKTFFLILIIFFFCGIAEVWGAVDYTPLDPGLTGSDATSICAATNAGISALSQRVEQVNQTAEQCVQKNDIQGIINEQFAQQTNEILGKVLTLLLVFTVFFFALLFIGKAKRWF